jgi:ethanolaminephosphotransferase
MYILAAFQIGQGLEGIPPIIATFFTAILTTAALSFKLAFTAEDAPELNIDFTKVIQGIYYKQSLVGQARIVFALLSACAAFAAIRSLTGGRRTAKASGKALLPSSSRLY